MSEQISHIDKDKFANDLWNEFSSFSPYLRQTLSVRDIYDMIEIFFKVLEEQK